ncbi:MAG: hypothetical protein C0405_14095, partial [Desulfovibrio sp.]|nr:hypothetical protein [Desulfovibrio sp.]
FSSATNVKAQGGPIDIQQFKPAMDSKGHFTVDSTQVLGPWKTSIGLLVNYAYRPLELKGENGRWFRVNDLVGANIQFALGLFKLSKNSKPWLEIGIGLPISFQNAQINTAPFAWENGQGGCTSQYGCTVWQQDSVQKEKYPMNYDSGGKATAQGLGDMYLHLKFRFLDGYTNPVGIGAMLSFYFPTSKVGGGDQRMMGYGGVGLAPKFILDRVWKKKGMLLSVNFGARLRFGSEAELKENSGWFGCSQTEINGGTLRPTVNPCGAAAENFGFQDKEPENGLTERVSWLYEITYGLGFSWTLAKQVVWTSELIGAIELSSLGKSNSTISTGAASWLGSTYAINYAKRVFPVELLTGFKFYLATSSFFAIGAGVGLTGVGP